MLLLKGDQGRAQALVGAAAGYVIAVVFAALAVYVLRVTGVYSPAMRDVWYGLQGASMKFHHVTLGAIAIAGAGIVADVAVSVTATVREVHAANQLLGRRALFRAGLRFGRDVICTEINTLPLAILGASLGGVLLVLAEPDVACRPYSWMILLNRQETAVALAAALAGTVALTLTIPLTAWAAAVKLAPAITGQDASGCRCPGGQYDQGQKRRVSEAAVRIPCLNCSAPSDTSDESDGSDRSDTPRAERPNTAELQETASHRQDGEPDVRTRWSWHTNLALLVLLAAFAVAAAHALGRTTYRYPSAGGGTRSGLLRARIVSAHPPASPWHGRGTEQRQEVMQQLLVRLADGCELTVENPMTGSPVTDRIAQPGEAVIVRLQEHGNSTYAALSEIERDRVLLFLGLAAAVAVALVAGWQGWRALAALAGCVAILLLMLTVMVRLQWSPLPVTLAGVGLMACVTYLVICRSRRTALSAAGGALAGLAVSGIAAMLFGWWLGLSGRCEGDLLTLSLYSQGRVLDFRGLLAAAALIGAAGVVMDVAIGVASAADEVHRANPGFGFAKLHAAGLSVGRKIMAAMFGAVLFAYLGLKLPLFLLVWASDGSSLVQTLLTERTVTELYRLLVAGLVVAWTIPATAVLSAWLVGRSSGRLTESETVRGGT